MLIDGLEDKDGEVRQLVAAALVQIGANAVDPLVKVLQNKDKDAVARANAAYVLGQIGPSARQALPQLTKAMKDEDAQVRRRVAFALARVLVADSYGGPTPGYPGMFMTPSDTTNQKMKLHDPGLVVPKPHLLKKD